jgi:MFS family permease
MARSDRPSIDATPVAPDTVTASPVTREYAEGTQEAQGDTEHAGTPNGSGPIAPAAATPSGPPPRKPRFSIRTFQSLADDNYRWYFVSLLGWFAAMNMQMFIRGYMVFQLTNSYAALGIVSLAQALPGMIFSFTGGVLADRVRSKKMLVQITTGANALNAVVIGVLITTGEIEVWHLYVNAAVQGALQSTMMPARQVLTTEVVGFDRLMNALALNQAGMNVNRLAMPAVGGGLLALFGTGTGIGGSDYVYYFMALLFAGAVLALMPVVAPPRDVSQRRAAGPGAMFSELLEGFRYMRYDPTVRMLLVVNVVLVVGTMPYQHMLPGFADDVLGADAWGLGILLSLQGVGALVGALVIASLPNKQRGLLLLLSSGALGLLLFVFSWSTWFWVTGAVLIGMGVGQSGRMALSQVLIHSYSQPEYRGRVMSIFMMEMSIMQLAVFLVGILANSVGPQWAMATTGLVTCVTVVYAILFLPTMRKLQ